MASVLRPESVLWSSSIKCVHVCVASACQMDKGGAKRNSLYKPYSTDPTITNDDGSNDSSLHHQILSQIFRPQRWPHAETKSTFRAFYVENFHNHKKLLFHLTYVPWLETIFDIGLRVNHHLNMAYTVYHGASSAASLSLCFLPVPPPYCFNS